MVTDARPLSPVEEARDILATAWLKPDMPPGFVKLTMRRLADIPTDELVEAMDHLARTTSWRPGAAEIRRTVVQLRGVFPSVAEAGRQGRRYATKRLRVKDGGPQPNYPFTHPAVADAVAAAGYDLTNPDGGPAFAKAYREAVDRRTSEIIAGPLNEPVTFRPVRVGDDRPPPDDVTWSNGGWRGPTGELIRGDSGSQPLPAALEQPALPAVT